jgi:cytidylate kinase
MEKQLLLSVGREFGSGGHEIAELLARRLDIDLLDDNLLTLIAEKKEVDLGHLRKYDEGRTNHLLYRSVGGYSNSPQENLAQMQFDYLKSQAEAGKSFVIVGRCAEMILRDYPGLISIFVLGDISSKKQRIMERHQVSESEAAHMMKQKDHKRKSYHNYYCRSKWGDSRSYDLTINSSRLGIPGTAEMLEGYIRARMAQWET